MLSIKSDVVTPTDSSGKQYRSSKTISFNVVDIHPYILCEKLKVIVQKPVRSETDITMYKMIMDEFLGTKNITRQEYKRLFKKYDFSLDLIVF